MTNLNHTELHLDSNTVTLTKNLLKLNFNLWEVHVTKLGKKETQSQILL